MCRLADIQYDAASIDGKLPKAFGGLEEREYTITESLHPKIDIMQLQMQGL